MTTPIGRAHLHLPITDASGNVYPYASVVLNDPATGGPTTEPVYVQPVGGSPVSFPLFCDPGVIDVWTANAVRVQLVATVSGNVRVQLDGIDIAPQADFVMSAPQRVRIAGADNIASTTVLASLGPNDASFQVADPFGTHEHQGDSAGSVVLTGEEPADFDPYQTWVGYQAGENTAANSTGSTALGPHAVLNGTSAVILGVGEVTTQTSTGVAGDFATVVSSEDSNASQGTTAVGAANLTRQGTTMTVLGSLNGPGSGSSVPTGAVVVGAGNVIGAAGAVKIGANHPTSTAGTNHTAVGPANAAQNTLLPWAASEAPTVVGGAVTLAGDPSTNASSDDWFGGTGPLALGVNSTAFNPSLTAVQATLASQALLRALGHVTVNGMPTWTNTSTTLGFYGATGAVRSKITYGGSDVFHQLLQDVLHALANTGLIANSDTTLITESGIHPDGTALEFAQTGQALQWKLPPTSPTYTATNPLTVASNRVVLAAGYPVSFPNRGIPALYSASVQDANVVGQFAYNPTATNLITNPDFEANTTGWSVYDSDTIGRDTSKSKYGSACLKITPSGTLAAARAAYSMGSMVAGSTFNFSAWVYPTTSRTVRISMDGYTSGFVYTSTFANTDVVLTAGKWTRISVAGTVPTATPNVFFNVGYFSTSGIPSASDFIWVDAAQVTAGTALKPYVDTTGYAPDDYFTGLMAHSYLARSVVSGQPVATPTGYLMGRKNVYVMSGNTVSSTVATLSTIPASGDVLQIQTGGGVMNFLVNGVVVATLTDTTYNTRVKYGFRVTESTGAYGFQVSPFG